MCFIGHIQLVECHGFINGAERSSGFGLLCAAVLGEDDAKDGDEDAEPLEEGEVLAADDSGDEGGGYAHHGEEDAGLAHA